MRKLLVLFAVCGAVLACDTRIGGPTTSLFPAELGTYSLQTMDGNVPPITLAPNAPNTTRKLVADTIALTSGGNIREVYYVSSVTGTNPPVVSSVTLAGKYTITRDSIGVPADFPYLYGRYSSGAITLVDADGFVWVFKR